MLADQRLKAGGERMSIGVQVAGQSDLGCVRSNNEDNFGYDWRYGIYVVCDGMGGEAAGEVASKLAVDSILEYCRHVVSNKQSQQSGIVFDGVSARANTLATAIQLANEKIRSSAAQNSDQRGMGSTVTAVLVDDGKYSIAHVGDSRIYLVRAGAIKQLTQDHSLVMDHVRRGLITLEQAQHSEMQNIIIRALGTEDTVEPDLSDLVAQSGDAVLLATDGLTRHVCDNEIARIIDEASSCKQACKSLIESANEGGGQDNITCLLLRFVEKSWAKKLFDGGPGEGTPKWQDSF